MNEYVVLYILSPDEDEVYYLRKNKPKVELIHNKLVGFGGKIEKTDKSKFQALKREIKEELDLDTDEFSRIDYRGYFSEEGFGKVYVYLGYLDYKLDEGHIKGEGEAKYYPIDYYKKNKTDFAKDDPIFLEELFTTDNLIEYDFR